MNFSVYPRGRNSHHIKPPDDAGNTTGVKRTPDVDPRETEAGEAEHSAERAGVAGFALLTCSGFYQTHINPAELSASLFLAAFRLFLKSTRCIFQLLL